MINIEPFPNCYKRQSKPHKFCPGCGHGIVLKELGFAIDELKIAKQTLIGVDIGCSLLAWDFFDVDTVQTHHGRTIPVVSGFKKVKPGAIAIAYVGDGGAYAIGLQSLLTSAHRNDPISVIVINNTLYGMTGGQMAPTSILDEKTTTNPGGQKISPFDGLKAIKSVADKKAYVARSIVTEPIQLRQMIKSLIENQVKNNSFSFLEVLSMCPVNWKMNSKEAIDYLEKEMLPQFPTGVVK